MHRTLLEQCPVVINPKGTSARLVSCLSISEAEAP
jgi:hypothetical protein